MRTLIDQLLDEQRQLTAVERFAQKHERQELPAQAKYYRDLIPLEKPRRGEQYAFAVDLDRCTGCKACVSACHSMNGLDEDESWRGVGLLIDSDETPWQQTVTSACHHCTDPACADGCPVLAYEKDDETGIVRHLDDQCIGCQYCSLKCPYDVPKYSKRLGIVRKCDMCHGRLAVGEAPACVQSCPSEAIRIEVVDKSSVPTAGALIPGAFPSDYTKPTTSYRSSKTIPQSAVYSESGTLRLEHAHWPLIAMLVLSQMAAGLHVAHLFVRETATALVGFGTLNGALFVSIAHLGRPLKAWRAVLGWRRSWMSREIIAFSVYAGLSGLLVLLPQNMPLAIATAFTALAGVFCSAMIYIDTRRPAWARGITFTRFFGATLVLGTTGAACILAWIGSQTAQGFVVASIAVRTWSFLGEFTRNAAAVRSPLSPEHPAAIAAVMLLPDVMRWRVALFAAASLTSIAALLSASPMWSTLALVASLAGCALERYTFFTACAAPRMPGL
jgi:Fe-S-cluster-containing dehydrogenase component/DMSO reductase anchor subunit